MGRVSFSLTFALRRTSEYGQAMAAAEWAIANASLPPVWTARLRALKAQILCMIGRFDDAEVDGRAAMAEGERIGDLATIGLAVWAEYAWQSIRDGDALGALETLNRGVAALGEDPETIDIRLQMLGNLAGSLADVGRTEEAVRAAADAVALAERTGAPTTVHFVRGTAAQIYFYAGRWDDALTEIQIVAAETDEDFAIKRPVLAGMAALIGVFRDNELVLPRLVAVDGSLREANEWRRAAQIPLLAQAFAAERDGQPTLALQLMIDIYGLAQTNPLMSSTNSSGSPIWYASRSASATATWHWPQPRPARPTPSGILFPSRSRRPATAVRYKRVTLMPWWRPRKRLAPSETYCSKRGPGNARPVGTPRPRT